MPPEQRATADLLREQARWCHQLGSPLYGALLERAADDVEGGGPCWNVLEAEASLGSDKGGSALALRFMAAVHRIVLEGRAPSLAAHFPSVGGRGGDRAEAWRSFLHTVDEHGDELQSLIRRRCQTNEVGRSRALVGGFLVVARDSGLPLRILEIGASAGLNLRWDRYHYRAGDHAWGDPASPVQFDDAYEGPVAPPFDVSATVTDRAGCDLEPIDPSTDEGRLALRSSVWADQINRFELLDGALRVALEVPVDVDRTDAVEWVEVALSRQRDGLATVVFHSVVMDQSPLVTRTQLRKLIEEAGARATASAPLAWLRMEGSYSYALLRFLPHEVWLTTWPGGEERKVADTGAHGRPVRWLV